jgi:hypothetical protein
MLVMAKKKRARKSTFTPPTDLECKGSGSARKARKLPKGAPNVCFRVRSNPSDDRHQHVAELFSGKTGQSLGFIGPSCTIVPTPAQAESSDYLNRLNTEYLLVNCIGRGWAGMEHVKPFKKALKEAQKKQPKGKK